jgi:hypothetical protein
MLTAIHIDGGTVQFVDCDPTTEDDLVIIIDYDIDGANLKDLTVIDTTPDTDPPELALVSTWIPEHTGLQLRRIARDAGGDIS